VSPYRILYVSTIWIYKHPWNVVKAVVRLRKKGYPVTLEIVGNVGQNSAAIRLNNTIQKHDLANKYIFWHRNVSLDKVSSFYKKSDIFVFASTCENMPNILVEAMASGLPIICSHSQPMPEFLGHSGIYFDPEDVDDLERSMEFFINNPSVRHYTSKDSYKASFKFTWEKCADETFDFLSQFNEKIN
jgi:glycosyltransferase involved in cell wall biosynthesis